MKKEISFEEFCETTFSKDFLAHADKEYEKLKNTEFTHNLTCPYCYMEYKDSWELDDSDEQYECENCGEIFTYYRDVTVTYTSYRKEVK